MLLSVDDDYVGWLLQETQLGNNANVSSASIYVFFFFLSSLFCFQFFTDLCSSSPCLHGNCSQSVSRENGKPAYTCECTEGYEGERCDQILLDLSAADWDLVTPSVPEPATPAASTMVAAPPQPTTITSSSTTPPLPTLQPWQPNPGQRLLVVPWEADRVR